LDAEAVGRIFQAKQRPSWDPVIVHVAGEKGAETMLEGLVRDVPEAARKLMKAFWPGPLTLLLPRTAAVPDVVTAGRLLVGVRMPAHPVALELIRRAGVPVAAPSANLFAHTSPTTAAHVLADLDGRIDAVVDAGPTEHGVESTVLDPNTSPMTIYRPGAVTSVQIRDTAGAVEFFQDNGPRKETPPEALPSPGVGLRHYAPRARLLLIESFDEGGLEHFRPPGDAGMEMFHPGRKNQDAARVGHPNHSAIREFALTELGARLAETALAQAGERVGVMLPAEVAAPAGVEAVYAWGRWSDPKKLARELYAGLRALDSAGCTVILCPLPPAWGIGAAIRDRLLKAGNRE
jgi:L-threonylcarbamoyladenylate synthase